MSEQEKIDAIKQKITEAWNRGEFDTMCYDELINFINSLKGF